MIHEPGVLFRALVLWGVALLLLTCLPIPSGGAEEVPYAHNLPPDPHPVEVRARFYLSDINEIDERTETFEIKGLLNLRWHDARHAFDPDEEGVREKHYQGTYQFLEIYNGWWPQLVLANGVGAVALQGVALRIAPDGTMSFVQEISAVVESPMNLRRYPFDRQRLQAIFEPLAFYADEVRVATAPNMTDLPDRPVRVAGWELVDLTAETRIDHDQDTDLRFSLFVVNLDMARRSG